jgi:hypothetical protein
LVMWHKHTFVDVTHPRIGYYSYKLEGSPYGCIITYYCKVTLLKYTLSLSCVPLFLLLSLSLVDCYRGLLVEVRDGTRA